MAAHYFMFDDEQLQQHTSRIGVFMIILIVVQIILIVLMLWFGARDV